MAVVTDRDRATGTITCSGSGTETSITDATLRTAFGLASNVACSIGGPNGYYSQFVFSVTLGTATSWSLSVDYFGEGDFIPVATGQNTGAVIVGALPGAITASAGFVGSCRPYAFKVTLNTTDATSTINVTAWKPGTRLELSAGDISSVSSGLAGIVTTLGEPTDDISATTVHGRLNAIRDDIVGIGGGTDLTPITTTLGTPAGASISADIAAIKAVVGDLGGTGKTLAELLDPLLLAYGTVTTGGSTSIVTCSAFIGKDLQLELLVFLDVSTGHKVSRTIASFNSSTGAMTVATLAAATAVGDKCWVYPRAQTAP
jgi:hypothetical protein